MAKKNALGRGLGALIEDAENNKELKEEIKAIAAAIDEIPLDKIEINPFQPRTEFDEEALQELAESIKQLGIIQPVTVRLLDSGNYQLITGERRFRASKIAGIDTLPAFVRSADDQALIEMALVENIQREDLNSIEIAISYQRLMEECSLTQENLGERVGKKRSTITNYLRLLKLPAEIQIGIKERKIGMGHAKAIIGIEDPSLQLKVYNRIVNEDMSVRKVEELVKKMSEPPVEKGENKSPGDDIPSEYENLKDHLSGYFNLPIEFKRNNKGTGRIVIPFKTDQELEHIVEVLDKLK